MTTIPSLPEIDLAHIAPLPLDQKRKALDGFKVARPPYSYNPVRASFGDLLNLDTALFGPLAAVPFERIAETIRAKSKFDKEAEVNIRVAAGLYAEQWRGRKQAFGVMGTSTGQRLCYWTPAVLAIGGKPVVPFINPRRNAMTPLGRRFAFSMMHEHIRVADPDYREAVMAICHFAPTKEGPRPARMTFDTGVELYSFDDLQAMIAETYAVWQDVYLGRVEDARRRGGGSGGGFL